MVDDHSSIPANELRPMIGNMGSWLKAIANQKLGRQKSQPRYAVELRRLKRAKHIPKRMEKHFEQLRSRLRSLEFLDNFEATIPAVGPYVSAIVAMSRRDGDIHFFGHRATTQVDGKLVDRNDFRFVTWLKDDSLLATHSAQNLPRPRNGVDQVVVASDDPSIVLRKHVERLRGKQIKQVSPSKLFDVADAENRRDIDDLLRRSVVRKATPGELTRIRMDSGV